MHPLSGQQIVFMPGMDGTGISFEPLQEVLASDVGVTIVRYPTRKMLSFAETVQCAGEQMPADQDVIMLAESFSGPVAIALVAGGHIKPKCLILCATFARPPRPVLFSLLSHMPLQLLIRLPFPRSLFKHLIEGGEQTMDVFLGMWLRIKAMVPAQVLVHRLSVISQMDVRGLLPKLTLPCLYIQATSDRSVPASSLSDFSEAIADLRVARISGPHFILQARPRAALAAIQDFLGILNAKPRHSI